jgi:hypothetical protein
MATLDGAHSSHLLYVRLCRKLAILGRRLRMKGGRKSADERTIRQLASALDLAGMEITAETVVLASRACGAAGVVSAATLLAPVLLLLGPQDTALVALSLTISVLIARAAIVSFPESAAKKQAAEVLRSSPEMANLMIMSLRHEPSLSKAIRFASTKDNAFSRELRRCVWTLVMGRYPSFEESLQEVGDRWSKYSGELKASLHAMVTASCESTDDGKRRALDRANQAMLSGAKRRIEEYALSLSTPSMIMFGLGILLPLMVGSFLPMLSWDIWAMGDDGTGSAVVNRGQTVAQTIFIMNLLFPAIGFLVAMNSVTRHPMDRKKGGGNKATLSWLWLSAAILASVALAALSALRLDGGLHVPAAFMAAVIPGGLFLMMAGKRSMLESEAASTKTNLEDALFRVGARMLEGENFESALNKASQDEMGGSSGSLRQFALRSVISGGDVCDDGIRSSRSDDSNAFEGFRVVREAATKDELAAGMLAMDIAAYLKDLRDLESALKSRLKPTISMMKMTAYALGPIVLGVTYAIYLSLGGVASGGTGGVGAGLFFLVLGAFLAETNAAVTYFLWGLEGKKDRATLMYSLGTCILASELVYTATVLVAS